MNNKTKYIELREKYPEFIYEGYDMENRDGAFHVTYHFNIPGLKTFAPTWEFPCEALEHMEAVEVLVFSLGMVELISYWKTTCSPIVKIKCGTLSRQQKRWWKDLYFNGLGEFFYVNEIDEVTVSDFMEIEAEEKDIEKIYLKDDFEGFLVPVGGGKDSVVSLELLKEMEEEVTTFSINRIEATKKVIDVYDEKVGDILIRRRLDQRLIELNKEGFLNGHTPFSAIVAFASSLTALLFKKQYIALSNETSANESTVINTSINHQYSKSFSFERDFRWYFSELIFSPISYFSLLRPLSELQIAKLFAKYEKYHKIFRSCNAGSKEGIWCRSCSKCLFVYIILAPFLSEEVLVEIFEENLLDKESLDVYFRELTGLNENKPFECVGTRREVLASVKHVLLENDANGKENPYLLETYRDFILENGVDIEPLYKEWVEENEVVPKFCKGIKRSLNE
jgi:hypothetical protein